MTKQEKIREGTKDRIRRSSASVYRPDFEEWLDIITDQILKYEDSQGVVIKVERELPDNPYEHPLNETEMGWGDIVYARTTQMLNDGYVAVEPLIETGIKGEAVPLPSP